MKESMFLILATLETCLSVAFLIFFIAGSLALFGEIDFSNDAICFCWWMSTFTLFCASAIASDVRDAWEDVRTKYGW